MLLPVKAAIADQVREPKVPETIVAGAEIDVDQPGATATEEGATGNKTDPDIVAIAVDMKAGKALHNINDVSEAEAAPEQIKPQHKQVNTRQSLKNIELQKDVGSVDISSLSSAELNSIKYSIQVGMYGRLTNAQNMVKQLQAKDFDAYVSDFTNKKNETRYNVRFGYFQDKQAAKSALKQYRQSQQADGYLVKFAADSVNSQGSNSLVKNRQPASYDLNKYDLDESKNESAAEELSNADDKLSRADSLKIENMIKAHGKLGQPITTTN